MMQRTIEFYPAANPMDPKKHHQQQEKNKPNKQTHKMDITFRARLQKHFRFLRHSLTELTAA